MIALVIVFPQMVMVYKSGESTVDPSKIQIHIQQESDVPATDSSGKPVEPATDAQQQEKSDDADKSLEDAFKQPPPK